MFAGKKEKAMFGKDVTPAVDFLFFHLVFERKVQAFEKMVVIYFCIGSLKCAV